VSVILPYLSSMQVTSFLCCIILSSVACSGSTIYFSLSHKWHSFHKKLIEHKVYFDFLYVSQKFPILRLILQDIIVYVHRSSWNYLLFLSDFIHTWMFLTDFWKIVKYQISCKYVQWEPSCFMQMDRWTNRHVKATIYFS